MKVSLGNGFAETAPAAEGLVGGDGFAETAPAAEGLVGGDGFAETAPAAEGLSVRALIFFDESGSVYDTFSGFDTHSLFFLFFRRDRIRHDSAINLARMSWP